MKIASLRKRDHFVCYVAKFFCFAFSSGNATILEQSRYEAAEQCFTRAADSSQSTTCHYFLLNYLSFWILIFQMKSETSELCQFLNNFIN